MKGILLKLSVSMIAIVVLLVLSGSPLLAAPSGQVDVESDNILELGDSQEVVVTFKNTADTDVTDVASTIQFITLSAANLNPTRTSISLSADWEIWESELSANYRASGIVSASGPSSEIYAPYSTTSPVDLYTWGLGEANGSSELSIYTSPGQFQDDLKILRPGELFRLRITVNCLDIVGDARLWFFFRATEYEPSTVPVSNIGVIPENERINLYYSKAPGSDQTPYWWPLHNSYDPYDPGLGTGHNFGQLSWNRGATTYAFAKSNKLVHQKPVEDIEQGIYSFHICGIKFWDVNSNGTYEPDIDPGIDGVVITLLGPDQSTKAEDYYQGKFSYTANEGNPLDSGENMFTGSYCFNLENVESGLYTFYIKEEVPPGWIAVTPEIIGPLTLEASDSGPRESVNNHFGNVQLPAPSRSRTAVGGEVYPINKMVVLAPWLGLAGAIIAGVYVFRRHHAARRASIDQD